MENPEKWKAELDAMAQATAKNLGKVLPGFEGVQFANEDGTVAGGITADGKLYNGPAAPKGVSKVEGLKKLKGSDHQYTEIAKRGDDRIAFSLMYHPHPTTGVGCLLTRFVAYREGGSTVEGLKISHFLVRDTGKLKDENGDQVRILRLNRNAIPLFSAGVGLGEVQKRGDDLQVWPVFAGWIEEQLKAEGFESTVDDMTDFVRGHFPAPTEADNISLLLELPDFANDKAVAKAAGYKTPFDN